MGALITQTTAASATLVHVDDADSVRNPRPLATYLDRHGDRGGRVQNLLRHDGGGWVDADSAPFCPCNLLPVNQQLFAKPSKKKAKAMIRFQDCSVIPPERIKLMSKGKPHHSE